MSTQPPPSSQLIPLMRISPTLPEVVHHYTSLQVLLEIVKSRKLWATNVRFLNDTKERDLFLEKVQDRLPNFINAASGIDADALKGSLLRDDLFHDDVAWLPSVVSFSRESDSLPQWRAYAPGGRGVSIGFNVSALKATSVVVIPKDESDILGQINPTVQFGAVEYLTAFNDYKIDAEINQAYDAAVKSVEALETDEQRASLNVSQFFRSSTEERSTFYKDGSFESESEYRLVASPVYWRLDALRFRSNDWSLVPYLELNIPNATTPRKPFDVMYAQPSTWSAIESVVVGPTADKELTAQSLRSLFRSLGMRVSVTTTNIPFRDW